MLIVHNTGIGRATVRLLAAEGCQKIIIADLNYIALEELSAEILSKHRDVTVKPILVDVKNEASVLDMVDRGISTFGRIDYCANVAGIIRFGDSSILRVNDFDDVLGVNLRGTFLCAKAEIIAMQRQEPLSSR